MFRAAQHMHSDMKGPAMQWLDCICVSVKHTQCFCLQYLAIYSKSPTAITLEHTILTCHANRTAAKKELRKSLRSYRCALQYLAM